MGGNAVDAAIATAAALGVTEPYSSGIGGGGYFVFYNAKKGKVQTLDGRETAPAGMRSDAFIDPRTGKPYNFTPELVTSGVSVGVPGTPATWDTALRRWGTWRLADVLKPATKLADRGFVVDKTFNLQTTENAARFSAFPSTAAIYLPGGAPPAVGSVLKNPDLADTYRLLADKGMKAFYGGKLAANIARTVQHPPKTSTTTLPVPPGSMKVSDIKAYRTVNRQPTKVGYRGYDVYGMAPSSSGGSTVGEALNIMERYDLAAMTPQAALHHYLEASALAFADRGAYVGTRGT
jgi:gamma-glutamyltranspeptidase/glutathione hydrolase